jgi:hypothetical protein
MPTDYAAPWLIEQIDREQPPEGSVALWWEGDGK